jgi:hypothetical protein
MSARRAERKASPLFEIARVLVRFNHVASAIVNAKSRRHVTGCKILRC